METNQIHFINFVNLVNLCTWHRWNDDSIEMAEGSKLYRQNVYDDDRKVVGQVEVGADFVDAHLVYVDVCLTSRDGYHEVLYRADAPEIVIDDVQAAIMSMAC